MESLKYCLAHLEMIISNVRITLCMCGRREREFYVTTVGPERGHMAADATEKRFWTKYICRSICRFMYSEAIYL